MKFDHTAINVKSIKESTVWYIENLDAEILYLDDTWAFLEVSGGKIALTIKSQHPAHICFEITEEERNEKFSNKTFKSHRDGSTSCYIKDLDGNFIEYLLWKN